MARQMKKLILISALLFSFNGWAVEQGLMLCEIKSMGVERIKDGKPESFTGYEGYEKVGDTLHFTYRASDLTANLVMNLEYPQDDNSIDIGVILGLEDLREKISPNIEYFHYEGGFYDGSFGKDSIWINSLGSQLNLSRYYKSDWDGIFTRVTKNGIYYFTVDCRHSIDLIDEVYETLTKLYDEKYPPKKTGVDGKISNPNP